MINTVPINWANLNCVIFDVDGTLYTQGKLRKRMLKSLLQYYGVRPWKLPELLMLRRFRAEREKQTAYAGPDLEADQYAWAARAGGYPVQQVRAVVERWMFQYPNQFLLPCRYPGVAGFFAALRARGISIGVYSDYPAQAKLAALELEADIVISSTDPAINRLKPHPQGLLHICQQLGLPPEQCLFIGDRPELDGACAEAAGMPYLIVEKQPFPTFTFYETLTNQLSTTSQPTPYESDVHSS
ncbi:HAD family hydrolase [Hymenobacter sublimis]|uniref:phosphoglycolate phosphatase n=1 Tax=Hymenobacter sublimis TaxID=2933777 RepID=A0ABY4JFG3_9BACT|nr:HAD family hydrolase [Hymenobacter sublimis]UPL50733.1 HAD family hydrolase [Hymenobacter sublimis]